MSEPMHWNDVTSYSQGEKDRTPKAFVANVGGLRIVVTRHIYAKKDEWVLNCSPWFDLFVVGTGSADVAKAAAIIAVRERLFEVLNCLAPEEIGKSGESWPEER